MPEFLIIPHWLAVNDMLIVVLRNWSLPLTTFRSRLRWLRILTNVVLVSLWIVCSLLTSVAICRNLLLFRTLDVYKETAGLSAVSAHSICLTSYIENCFSRSLTATLLPKASDTETTQP
jgi:hypothetical protein